MKEKAQLVINLLKEYFKDKDIDSYNVLCNYNSNTDLMIWEDPLICGEFTFAIGNNEIVLDISPTIVQKIYCNNSTELIELINFYELCGSCVSIEDNGSWDKAINYLKSVNGCL